MYTYISIILCFAIYCSEKVLADGDNEVKRGAFPFMAFIYYPDETIVDARGLRFLRSAVLIRPDWLVTSAVGPSVLNTPYANFPRKTLLARLGAVTIDSNTTLNEDEDEQEREVIQIVRPYNHSATQWWLTDISLMKTLLPFNVTSAVNIATFNFKRDYNEKNCFILVYSKRDVNLTEDKILMQLFVELLPSTRETCGPHFVGDTMICAADSNEHKDAIYDPDFCQGNSGGPLLCDNEVIGLQTYIENNCKQPHLYQLMSAWDNFITCGTEDACQEEKCANVCIVATKDNPVTEHVVTPTQKTEDEKLFIETQLNIEDSTTTILEEKTIEQDETVVSPTKTTIITSTIRELTTKTKHSTTTDHTRSHGTVALDDNTPETTDWTTGKSEEIKEIERRISMEAQQQQKAPVTSRAKSTICVLETTLSAFLISTCLA
ncbi:uncharacterized protein LOC115443963 [Manduca sexta]|uniref:uncharacterized protein LOC115443963 n=1 Tax=Manduca sexta TaxID=7130 RepID=UPI00188E133F|nr:uncharacterized protein LOC115443963 [Manduca sexta]